MAPPNDVSDTSIPRLLVLCEYPTLGGGEYSLLTSVPYVQRASFEVVFAAPPHGPLADALASKKLELIPFETHIDDHRLPQQDLRSRLAQLLRDVDPQLLHANSLSMGRLSGPVAAEMGLPSIAHLRDILKLSAAAVADLNRHRRLIAVSAATCDAHVRQGLDAHKTRVIYNGVDLEAFRPSPPTGWLHRELSLPAEALLVGSIGQLVLRKGTDVLAAAARSLTGNCQQVHYVIVGRRYSQKDEARQYEHDLRAAFDGGELAGRAHFLGVRSDIAALLPELTLLVHTARQEPLGRVLLEASAAGVPIIATDVGGTREIFPPSGQASAVVIPPDDTAALVAATGALLSDPPRQQRLAAAARKRAEGAFAAPTAAQRLIQQYREVLAGR